MMASTASLCKVPLLTSFGWARIPKDGYAWICMFNLLSLIGTPVVYQDIPKSLLLSYPKRSVVYKKMGQKPEEYSCQQVLHCVERGI